MSESIYVCPFCGKRYSTVAGFNACVNRCTGSYVTQQNEISKQEKHKEELKTASTKIDKYYKLLKDAIAEYEKIALAEDTHYSLSLRVSEQKVSVGVRQSTPEKESLKDLIKKLGIEPAQKSTKQCNCGKCGGKKTALDYMNSIETDDETMKQVVADFKSLYGLLTPSEKAYIDNLTKWYL